MVFRVGILHCLSFMVIKMKISFLVQCSRSSESNVNGHRGFLINAIWSLRMDKLPVYMIFSWNISSVTSNRYYMGSKNQLFALCSQQGWKIATFSFYGHEGSRSSHFTFYGHQSWILSSFTCLRSVVFKESHLFVIRAEEFQPFPFMVIRVPRFHG